ncbi:pyridoxamine kinase [Mesorhizobium sp. Root554]|uniref:pyridoxal kinase PdxY n=1 Tax=unclassified Mesorhizobium TaxID=325217 RepID=UPI0006F9810B|nr:MULTISPECIES: pyridoxal kinase PdxY [unclassified Mesorhizobium]KQZ15194.1 pyridoxamine kinase [Mesorhizobium sp. Root1471]KQZ37702.1 pyridoxamine kinase [Mesorhizobium sp. Root554]
MSAETTDAPRAVIVVSSHVARGSVGNRAAVFALECLGFPVWAVPTVILPWHPGHGRATRIVPPAEQFTALMADLERAPWLGEVGAVLSGYLGDASQADAVAGLVRAVKTRNPASLYICDPVLGDSDGLYVPEPTAIALRDRLIPLADIATPNRYELEWLTGVELPDLKSTIAAALHAGPPTMLVTSAQSMMAGGTGNLLLDSSHALLAEHRVIAQPPNGLGDLTAAIYLARIMSGQPPAKALQTTTAAVYEILARTAKRGGDELQLETDAQSLSHPMAMVQLRHLLHPGRNKLA